MSINPVSRSLLPYYGPLAAAYSPSTAGAAPLARETVTPAARSNTDPGEPVESALERALRQARIYTGTSTSGESNSQKGRTAPGIGLYRRVSLYSDERSSASGLMKSWNDIVRENQFEGTRVAGYVQAVAQNDTVALPTRILHLTV